MEKQERFLRGKPEVIVATPGRLWELMRGGAEHLTDLQDLSFLVLDEADRMVQQGHYEVIPRPTRPKIFPCLAGRYACQIQVIAA